MLALITLAGAAQANDLCADVETAAEHWKDVPNVTKVREMDGDEARLTTATLNDVEVDLVHKDADVIGPERCELYRNGNKKGQLYNLNLTTQTVYLQLQGNEEPLVLGPTS